MDRLGQYSILDKIGEGGMGQVFRARDEQLGREAAIKVLPPALTGDAERLARFEREARLLATLNHPGIAAIYGMHEADGVRFLAMEYVPGEDLAKRLERGPLPLDEALRAAARIAEALESAHEKGIVHRDLKPANVIVGEDSVKILDFGLAKMLGGEEADSQSNLNLSNSPTRVVGETVANVILGTAAYMSPEQARGKRVDRRTDVWAFGCVLYEMLTGRAAYGGETVSDTIGAVLHVEPQWNLLPPATPAPVRTLLRRCLEKDRAKRLRDVGDALVVIQEVLSGGGEAAAAPAGSGRRALAVPIATALLGATLAALVVWFTRPAPPRPSVTKFSIPMQDATSSVYLSPDGKQIAWFRDHRLMMRSLDELEFHELDTGPGPMDGDLAWSPDGSQVAFVRDGQLWKIPVQGGRPVSICRLPGTGRVIHLSWGRDGHIAFASWRGGMFSVNAEGGTPDTVIAVNQARIVDFHRVEHLPDGSLLFDTHVANDSLAYLEGLSRWAPSGTTVLVPGNAQSGVYSPTGHLLYVGTDDIWGRLMAVPFSISKMQVTGEPFRIADNAARPFVGANGTLAYTSRGHGKKYQATWFDRNGRTLGAIGDPMEDLEFATLSPDGSQLAVTARVDGETAIWIIDVNTGARRRLTFAPGAASGESEELYLAWSPDGKDLVFARSRNLRFTLYALAADGTGNERELFPGLQGNFSRDGRYFVFGTHELDASGSLWVVEIPTGGRLDQGRPREFIRSTGITRNGRISPDGRFIAFEIVQDDRTDVFLAQFPSGEGRWQISTGGGREPRWNPDGSSIYYADNENVLYEVPLQTRPVVVPGRPRRLFGGTANGFDFRNHSYAAMAGGRFLVNYSTDSREEGERSMVIVQNWYEAFRGKK